MGHYHEDTGEGLDTYDEEKSRGGWDRSADFPDKESSENYLAGFAERLKSSVKVSLADS